jgi:alanine racemase
VRPRIALVGSILRANVRAYAALGSPVAAVVKNDGYGWGAAHVAREIDDLVESYVVADEAEFWALRMRTRRPIRLLEAADPARIAALCAHGAIPNVSTPEAVAAAGAFGAIAGRPATIRIGIIDAAGWAGIPPAAAPEFAALCARHGVRVELWTHITSAARSEATVNAFESAVVAFRHARVDCAGTDCASTAWASTSPPGDRVRIGAGLFGARLGGNVITSCAIRVDAPLVAWYPRGTVRWAGYGENAVPARRGVAVLRCGYGDGYPKELAGDDDILSVGMQYTTRLAESAADEHALIDERSDLDQLAFRAGLGAHELIVGLAQQT